MLTKALIIILTLFKDILFTIFFEWFLFPGQRCLETGIYHVKLLIDEKELEKDKMKTFIDIIKGTGLNLKEGNQFQPNDPFRNLKFSKFKTHIKPWEVVDE